MASSRLRPIYKPRIIPPFELVSPPTHVAIEGVNNRVFVEDGTLPPGYVHRIGTGDAMIVKDTQAAAEERTRALASATIASQGPRAVVSHTAAAQAVINTSVSPAHAAIADAVAANGGRAVVPVPPSYASAPKFVDAHLAQSSVQAYWWPPTFVSSVTPSTADAHAVSLAATSAARTL